jgi:hypothetical protein
MGGGLCAQWGFQAYRQWLLAVWISSSTAFLHAGGAAKDQPVTPSFLKGGNIVHSLIGGAVLERYDV